MMPGILIRQARPEMLVQCISKCQCTVITFQNLNINRRPLRTCLLAGFGLQAGGCPSLVYLRYLSLISGTDMTNKHNA